MANSNIPNLKPIDYLNLSGDEQIALQELLALMSNLMTKCRTQGYIEYDEEKYYKFVELMSELSGVCRLLPHFGQPKGYNL